ncbi:MAG: IPT/TIG domain-containing protein, partial [Acidobacteria bacterium]|nr:IPT/TIG domain-containing protein [Acidobacteriota bacterium]
MKTRQFFPILLASMGGVFGQTPTVPIIQPRGVMNAVSQQPAPSTVSPGGIIWINGLNLGPTGGARAPGTPLPTSLGDPAVQVLINGTPAPLFSVGASRIVAQAPWDVAPGVAEVVVRRGSAQSRPARVLISPLAPAVRSAGEDGFGEAFTRASGTVLQLSATGLGPADPPVNSGEAGPADGSVKPMASLRAFVGGLPAEVTASLSPDRVGEFDVNIALPALARPGDIISLRANNQTANRTTYRKVAGLEMLYVRIPEGAPDLRSLAGADLRGNFMIGSAARGSDGCWPTYLFDLPAQRASKIDSCLTAENPNTLSPVATASEDSALAALIGPPEGQPPAGASSKVLIFNPASQDNMMVQLPSAASSLTGGLGAFRALLPGSPSRVVTIDPRSGAVSDTTPEAPAGVNLLNLAVDAGDGLTQVLSLPVTASNGTAAVVVGDSADQPKRMKLVILDPQGEIMGARDFPEGWTALVAPRQPAPAVTTFPESWFAAACTARVPAFTFQLSSSIAIPATTAPETEFKNPCLAKGIVLLDPVSKTASAVSLPNQGQMNAALGATGVLNDYLYGGNSTTADTLYVLDGLSGSVSPLSL